VRYGEPAGRWVLFATVLGSALAFIDATVVNIALPRLGMALGAGAAGLQWTINGYTLSLTSFILLGGSLGDRFGRRRMFVLGTIWFAIASFACGIAPSMSVLIAARVIQGMGGALLTPGSLALLETSFEPGDRARAVGAWSGLGGVAGALGPFLGGWLVEVASFRLVFFINLPLALLVVLVTLRHVPESRDPERGSGLDVMGALTAVLSLGAITYGFTAWPEVGPRSPSVLIAFVLGIAGALGFVVVEGTSSQPMLPLGMFRSRAFTAANLVTLAVYAALGGMLFFVALNLQVVAGFTPLAAGTALLPVTVLMLLFSARAGSLAERIGPRYPMTAGPLVCAVGLLLLARVGPKASYLAQVFPGVLVLGLGLAMTVAPLTATALGSVDERRAGIASGVNNAVARAGGLLAVAVLPAASGLGQGSLTRPESLAPTYRAAMLLCAGLLSAGAAIAFLAIPSRKGPRAEQPYRAWARLYCAIAGTPLQPEPRSWQGKSR